MGQNNMQQPNNPAAARIHPAAEVGTVTLKVADLARSLDFYTQTIGLQVLRQQDAAATLGAGDRAILSLEAVRGARPTPRKATGLYHAAILFPDRRTLAIKIAQLAQKRVPFGYADHLVSEAFYLNDPDENGLELYRDRPRSEWAWEGDTVRMASDPIDFDSLFAEIRPGEAALNDPAAPAGTKLGHMHLRIGDVAQAEAFYHGVLGFDITARWPGALFMAAGGYHHHLGLNTWESRGASAPIEPSAGLREFSITLPDGAELERLIQQIEAAGVSVERESGSGVVYDPWRTRIRLVG